MAARRAGRDAVSERKRADSDRRRRGDRPRRRLSSGGTRSDRCVAGRAQPADQRHLLACGRHRRPAPGQSQPDHAGQICDRAVSDAGGKDGTERRLQENRRAVAGARSGADERTEPHRAHGRGQRPSRRDDRCRRRQAARAGPRCRGAGGGAMGRGRRPGEPGRHLRRLCQARAGGGRPDRRRDRLRRIYHPQRRGDRRAAYERGDRLVRDRRQLRRRVGACDRRDGRGSRTAAGGRAHVCGDRADRRPAGPVSDRARSR